MAYFAKERQAGREPARGGAVASIAVSACLLGQPCRFDGRAKPSSAVQALAGEHRLVPVCPEVLGGLPVPRPPAEVQCGAPAWQVVNAAGEDVTAAYKAGAREACAVARREGCTAAVLKAKSPACGCGLIYDGTFSGRLVPGWGVAAAALREAGISVVDEHHTEELRPLLDGRSSSGRIRGDAGKEG